MSDIYINALSYYLPKGKLTNEMLSGMFPGWSPDKIASKVGVSTRNIASESESAADLAYLAAQNLFKEYAIQPSSIDFILYCTQSPDYFLPATSCILQERLGIPVSAGALDFNLGCSGYVYGLALAKGLISAHIAKNILLLTADTYSKFIYAEDKSNRTIFGDGASATLISDHGFARIGEFILGTDGKGAENLIIRNGAMKHLQRDGSPGDYLFMNGTEIFNFTSKEIPPLITLTLNKNRIGAELISQYIFHQANMFMLTHLQKKLGIPSEKFYADMSNTGNTVSSTIPIALYCAMKKLRPSSEDNWLLAGFGVGYSWAATILTFKI
ncbi:ketoacyl-ACP synthase III [Mucilaginibacter aquaedulcis]|uniref:ketoacyl-ACP synthase III n=1 Tax=Mucilaginibacter aquaedulcis TaxID=1187081 RepID=UPI0025B2B234|nr:ketoacyl-ACP synthase III [Mucilaginibacter aquaedulcis]MDN3548721.1 ketoacyl-ACP synthase III [Mucilaginibacter aquaedulcis]